MTAYLEDGYFKAGGTLSPLASSLSNSLLKDADPVIYYLLQYYAGVINLHMGARWNAEAAAAGRSDLANLTTGHKVPFDPIPYLQENQFKFPLLAAYRKNERYEWFTTTWYRITSTVEILWIMPPMSTGQMERMSAFRAHVARTLVDRTAMGFDTNFNSGEQVWHEAGLDKIGIKAANFGNIPTDTGLVFPTILLECELVERRMPAPEPGSNYVNLTGIDGYISSASDVAVIDPLDFEVDTKTEF